MFLKKTSIAALALAMGGCTSFMVPAPRIAAPPPDSALVTFVRDYAFMVDGAEVHLWDGTTYIGALGANKMVQYEARPGRHLFMGNTSNWTYANAELEPGKQYFLKANMFYPPIAPRVAFGVVKQDDTRVPRWMDSLEATQAPPDIRAKYEAEGRDAAANAAAYFEAGKVWISTKVGAEHAR